MTEEERMKYVREYYRENHFEFYSHEPLQSSLKKIRNSFAFNHWLLGKLFSELKQSIKKSLGIIK